MSEDDGTGGEEPSPQHSPFMLFLLVLVFFVTGLVGILICHVLKEKGYRCRTALEELDLESRKAPPQDESEDMNEDTVEQIVQCIIHNEANLEALKELLVEQEGKEPAVSRVRPLQGNPGSVTSHHHTVHLGSAKAPCMHCSKRKKIIQQRCRETESRGRVRPGEVVVFSVGRFRVTHVEKKPSIPEQDSLPSSTANFEQTTATQQESNGGGCSKVEDDMNSPVQADVQKDERIPNGTLQREVYINGIGTRALSKEDVEYTVIEDAVQKDGALEAKVPSSTSTENSKTLLEVKERNQSISIQNKSHRDVAVPSSYRKGFTVQDDVGKDRKTQQEQAANGTVLSSSDLAQAAAVEDERVQKEDRKEESRESYNKKQQE